MDRIIQMIINAVLRQVVNRGVRSGIDRLAGAGKPRSSLTDDGQPASDAQTLARNARRAANLARRLGK